MAAGDLLGKRQGASGIAFEDTSGTAEAAPNYLIPCDSMNIDLVPNVYERVNNITENKIGIEQAGNDYAFNFSGAELDAETIGYLLWLFSGDGTTDVATSPHTITPEYDSKYLTCFKDHGGIFDGTNTVERLAGSRISQLTIDQQQKAYAKIALSGLGRSLSPDTTPLVRNLTLGDTNAPLSWAALQTGSVSLGFNDAAAGATTKIRSLKFDFQRETERAGADLASNDPSAIVEGGRMLTVEFTLDLRDSNSEAEDIVAAVKSAHNIEIGTAIWVTGTTNIAISVPTMRVTSSPPGEIGTGTDPQLWTVTCEAYQNDVADDLYSVIATDGQAVTYAGRPVVS